jgi:hypothetical protein
MALLNTWNRIIRPWTGDPIRSLRNLGQSKRADRDSSPSPAGATDVVFAVTHTDANDDGDWLTTAVYLNYQETR